MKLREMIVMLWLILPALSILVSEQSWKEKIQSWLVVNGIVIGLAASIAVGYIGYLWLISNGY